MVFLVDELTCNRSANVPIKHADTGSGQADGETGSFKLDSSSNTKHCTV